MTLFESPDENLYHGDGHVNESYQETKSEADEPDKGQINRSRNSFFYGSSQDGASSVKPKNCQLGKLPDENECRHEKASESPKGFYRKVDGNEHVLGCSA